MSASAVPAQQSLLRTLTVRLVLSTLAVMLTQAAILVVRDYFNHTEFLNSYVHRETQALARALDFHHKLDQPGSEPPFPQHYLGKHADAYAFRIIDSDGRIIAGRNAGVIALLSPWAEKPTLRQDLWFRRLDASERMHFAGGVKRVLDGREIWIELATFGDPASSYLGNILQDLIDDVWAPLLPIVAIMMLVTATSVRRQLRPLVSAASRADQISSLERGERLDIAGLPLEASHFASAINRLLDRVADLVSTERLFIARAAHELRTPLSIMMLEIGQLKDEKARRLEADVRAMSEIVDRLLSLARMQASRKAEMVPVRLATIVRELVGRMLGWAEQGGHRLNLETHYEGYVLGEEATLRDAVRNLIENAVKHTPAGTEIRIQVTPDAKVVVEDNGPGLAGLPAEELLQPFRKGATAADGAGLGLAIVRQAVEMHNGRFEIGTSPLGGARFAISFPDAARVRMTG